MAASARFPWRLVAAALLVVLVVFAVRWPLVWAVHWLPRGVVCERPAGSLWRGRCEALIVGAQRFDATTWQVRALPLLRATLAADVTARQGPDSLRGEIERRPGGRLIVQHAEGDLTLGEGLLRDRALGLHGRLHVEVERAVLHGRSLADLVGVFTVRQLRQGTVPMGDVEVRFEEPAPGADTAKGIQGTLRDLGGPLGIDGHVTLTPDAGYVVDGFVTLRADTAPALARQIAFLGTPDAAGRRPFSIAGTY